MRPKNLVKFASVIHPQAELDLIDTDWVKAQLVLGCFPSKEFLEDLLLVIAGRPILEVMAGSGYLGKWLSEAGLDVICTDIGSYKEWFKGVAAREWYPVEKLEAVEAVKKYRRPVVIAAFPSFLQSSLFYLVKNLMPGQVFIYIGTPMGFSKESAQFLQLLKANFLLQRDSSDFSVWLRV